jgi:hypothetical protein
VIVVQQTHQRTSRRLAAAAAWRRRGWPMAVCCSRPSGRRRVPHLRGRSRDWRDLAAGRRANVVAEPHATVARWCLSATRPMASTSSPAVSARWTPVGRAPSPRRDGGPDDAGAVDGCATTSRLADRAGSGRPRRVRRRGDRGWRSHRAPMPSAGTCMGPKPAGRPRAGGRAGRWLTRRPLAAHGSQSVDDIDPGAAARCA